MIITSLAAQLDPTPNRERNRCPPIPIETMGTFSFQQSIYPEPDVVWQDFCTSVCVGFIAVTV